MQTQALVIGVPELLQISSTMSESHVPCQAAFPATKGCQLGMAKWWRSPVTRPMHVSMEGFELL